MRVSRLEARQHFAPSTEIQHGPGPSYARFDHVFGGAPAEGPAASADAPPDTSPDAGPCAGKAEGTTCDDGNPCTMADACKAGVCAGVAIICQAQDACHDTGTCNPTTGACSNPAKA